MVREEKNKIRLLNSRSERMGIMVITIVLILLGISMTYPMINVLSTSFSGGIEAGQGKVKLLPVAFNTESWQLVLNNRLLWRSLLNNIYVASVGTLCSLLFTAFLAYPLSNRNFKFRRILMFLVVFTMVFRYPIIPYFLTVRSLGLINKLNVLIITHLLVAYNLVIMRTFFQGIPPEMEESAYMDGANPFQILFRIVLPLSKPVMATLGLFFAVTYWNLFIHPMLFLNKPELFTLQTRLRAFIEYASEESAQAEMIGVFNSQTVEAATIIFATLPILLIYPFLQKYFVKGAMIGSLKG